MAKRIGYGTTLSLSTSAVALSASTTAVFTVIGQVRNIEGPNVESGEVDATTLDSTANYREFLLGLNDPGNLNFTVAWDSTLTSHVFLTNAKDNRNQLNVRIEPPSSTAAPIYMIGYVKSFGGTFPLEDLVAANVGIRLSGPIRWPST